MDKASTFKGTARSKNHKKTSVADRIAALQKGRGAGGANPSIALPSRSKIQKGALIADRIAALRVDPTGGDGVSSGSGGDGSETKNGGKLTMPAGGVPIPISFGLGPSPSLLRRQLERAECKERLRQEALDDENNRTRLDGTSGKIGESSNSGFDGSETKKKIGRITIPAGGVLVMPMPILGAGPPPSLLRFESGQTEHQERLRQEASDEDTNRAAKSAGKTDELPREAGEEVQVLFDVLSRPTIKGGKRRARSRRTLDE